jgi:hypothetical protein
MGEQHPYDGIQQHPYVMGNPQKDKVTGVEGMFLQTAARTMNLESLVQHTRDDRQTCRRSRGQNRTDPQRIRPTRHVRGLLEVLRAEVEIILATFFWINSPRRRFV